MANTVGLLQQSDVTNEHGSQLDLVLSDLPCVVTRSFDPLVREDIHHPAINIDLTHPALDSSAQPRFVPNFFKCNINKLREELLTLNIKVQEPLTRSDDCFNQYILGFSNLVNNNTPLKRVGMSPFPRWFSNELKNLIIEKKRMHKLYKRSGHDSDYASFARARAACKALAKDCYNSYISHVNRTITTNPKVFWSHVNNLRRSDSTPSKLKLGEEIATDPHGVCNLLANHFSSVYSDPLPTATVFPSRDNIMCLSFMKCSSEEVKLKIDNLDIFKGCGPDGIPPVVLHHCSDLVSGVLARLFNHSLQEGYFPSSLKTSYVVPIFKDGNRDVASNYRPITIQSPIVKIFESIVLDRLKPLISSVLIPEQHGFTVGRSTSTNLVVFEDYVLSAFTKSLQVDAIYLDCSKAFDKVDHAILISKLKSYGIMDPLLSWMSSYLTGRSSVVRFANSYSAPFKVISGVPQGSLLGPYLFNLFMNDISEVIDSKFLLFADDIKLFMELGDEEDCRVLQHSLDNISNWCSSNRMKLNASKCSVISFCRSETIIQTDYYIENTSLQRCEAVRDLGVVLNSRLTPDHHIETICCRASKLLGFLFRGASSGLSVYTIATLYKSLLRPILEYASVVWKPHYTHHIIRLERIQRKFLRLLGTKMGLMYREVPVDDLMTQFKLCPLVARLDFADLVFLFKLLNGAIDCQALLARMSFRIPKTTRSTDLFVHSHYRTNYLKSGPIARFHRLGNSVPAEADFFFDNLRNFKSKVLQSLTSRAS